MSYILAESFDTGDPNSGHAKFYVRKINKQYYGRFKWNNGKSVFQRVGGDYPSKIAAIQAAKVSTL